MFYVLCTMYVRFISMARITTFLRPVAPLPPFNDPPPPTTNNKTQEKGQQQGQGAESLSASVPPALREACAKVLDIARHLGQIQVSVREGSGTKVGVCGCGGVWWWECGFI